MSTHMGASSFILLQLGYFALSGSSMSHHSPVCEKSWKYFTGSLDLGSDEKLASVEIVTGGADSGSLQALKQRFREEDCETPVDYLMKYILL